jgi:hypothetical protein
MFVFLIDHKNYQFFREIVQMHVDCDFFVFLTFRYFLWREHMHLGVELNFR